MRVVPLVICLGSAACGPLYDVLPPDWSGEPADSALLWNGARHTWGYNHRLNRLGNWVGPMACDGDTCEVEVAHAAASGLGSDVAAWEGWGTLVHAPGVGFLAGSTSFAIDLPGAEGRRIEETVTVTVPAEGLLADRDAWHAVLAGYDVFALEDADMYQSATFEVGDVTYDPATNALSFPVRLGLQVDCDVVECDGTWDVGGKMRTDVHYGAHVMWTLVATDDATGRVTCEDRHTGYAWPDADDGGPEVFVEEFAVPGVLRSPQREASRSWPVGALAFQKLSLALDAESHMVEFATALRDVRYDPAAGEADYVLDLFFKQWNAESADRVTSYATPGQATGEATVCLLQVRDGAVEPVALSGSLAWDADGGPATGERAVDRLRFALTLPDPL